MLLDETCLFLTIDFDRENWMSDAAAFVSICCEKRVPVAMERSRSGNGAHAWFFFSKPVSARLARQMGLFLLTEAIEKRPGLGLTSYDRLFPCQDTLPKGGFGNLIALPLQGESRKNKNSVFTDCEFNPYPDQWAFLAGIEKIRPEFLSSLMSECPCEHRVTGVRFVNLDEDMTTPWLSLPSRVMKTAPPSEPLPELLDIVYADQLYFEKSALTPWLRNRLVRLAAFQNPEFYRAQSMRLPVYGIPRIVACAEEYPEHIALPRGCLDEVNELLAVHAVQIKICDRRNIGKEIDLKFQGTLRPEQHNAVDKLKRHDTGVLAATTAFGKTVAAAWMIAERGVNTLVIVHTKPLLEQWRKRLSFFLDIPITEIGVFGGGKKKLSGAVDVAIMQSLVHNGVVNDVVGEYGHVVFDECHHLSAPSFEAIARRVKAKYVLGLTATVTRKDGQHPIIMMQCGPIRHRVDAKLQAAAHTFIHIVHIHPTGFYPPELKGHNTREHFQELYRALIDDSTRNELIAEQVVNAVKSGRSPIVLTERKEHLKMLEQLLRPRIANVITLCGGFSAKESNAVKKELEATADCVERVIVATGKFIGEGFDDPRLDTLFITLPISWRGTVAQYAGRLHREYVGKREVVIHDYADLNTPMLARMFERRCKGYEAIGYSIHIPASAIPGWPADVPLPSEPSWKNTYAVSLKRLARDGLDSSLGNLFMYATQSFSDYPEGGVMARSASEAFLFRRLETLPETRGKFRLNYRLPIPFCGFPDMEVDLSCREARIAIEIDGQQHLNDSKAYRRDRNKDLLLQENGWIVLRCLAEDIAEQLDSLLDDIIRLLTAKARSYSERT
jgi:superfamily II DNA or RNA helicase